MSINDIINVIRTCTKQHYNAKQIDSTNQIIEKNVQNLFEQDYICQYISNTNGELSLNYPRQILVPIIDKWSEIQTPKIQLSVNINDQCTRSCFARCRSRLVAPALLIDGRYVCRSATLSAWGEIYPRFSMDLFVDATNQRFGQPVATNGDITDDIEQPQQRSIFDKLRGADIDLLKIFDVGSIINLMVQEKNALFGVKLTASEKFDKYERYKIFQLISLPYPGCEHFREVSAQKYNGEFILHDWSLSRNAAILEIPDHLLSCVTTDWSSWRSWSTLYLTQNYLQIIIRHLEIDKKGILIHCLSGWDRTPLFICLLRLSLWADGFIHQSLTVEEILYLTLAYDWYLFGHNLPERLSRNEEILYFTFMALPYIVDDEFTFRPVTTAREQSASATTEVGHHLQSKHYGYVNNKSSSMNMMESPLLMNANRNISRSHSANTQFSKKTMRKEKLLAVFQLFHTCYRNVIPENSSVSNNRPLIPDMARKIKNFMLQK